MFSNLKNELVENQIFLRSYRVLALLLFNLVVWYFFISLIYSFFGLIHIESQYSDYFYTFFSLLAQASTVILGFFLIAKNTLEIAFQMWLPYKK